MCLVVFNYILTYRKFGLLGYLCPQLQEATSRTLKWHLNDALIVLNEHLTSKHFPFCILGKGLN